MATITPDSAWRDTGPCPPDDWHRVLRPVFVSTERDAMYDVAGDLSLLCLSQAGPESNYGDSDIYDRTGNLLGLRPRPNDPRPVYQHPTKGPFLMFGSPEECVAEWRSRILDPTYKGGIYTPGTTTILEFVNVYAPAGDGDNDPDAYCARIVADMNWWIGDEPLATYTTPIPGLPKPIKTSFPVRVALMPEGQTNQRPGDPFTGGAWDRYTQHETGNTKPGADVKMHEEWLRSDPGQVGFHLCVDDREAAVFVPLDEIAWHAGDSGGPGNYDSIACELCVNADGDTAKGRANAEELCAQVLKARGFGTDRLVQHNYWSGKNCPMQMRTDGYWPTFVANVGAHLGAPPPPDLDYPPGWDEAIAREVWGAKYAAYQFNPAGTVSPIWLEERVCSPLWYHFKDTADGRELFQFSSGHSIGRLNAGESFRVLSKPT